MYATAPGRAHSGVDLLSSMLAVFDWSSGLPTPWAVTAALGWILWCDTGISWNVRRESQAAASNGISDRPVACSRLHLGCMLSALKTGEDQTVQDLYALVDFDNLDAAIARAPLQVIAETLVGLVPLSVIAHHKDVRLRIYGGWREGPRLTRRAQGLVPILSANFPRVFSPIGTGHQVQIHAELASAPLSIPSAILNSTLAHDRGLRRFRARPTPWSECARPGACGFSQMALLQHDTPCGEGACTALASDILVRSEQKMVDTCMAVDMTYIAHVLKAPYAVVVSSDVDMWPGILTALAAGTNIVQLHTKRGLTTQSHLLRTIPGPLRSLYGEQTI